MGTNQQREGSTVEEKVKVKVYAIELTCNHTDINSTMPKACWKGASCVGHDGGGSSRYRGKPKETIGW